MVTNLDQYDSKGFIVSAYVLSNTANAMTFAFDDSTASPLTFNIGNRFEIRRVLTALDQPGRGRGDLCTGGAVGGFHNTVGSDGWPHEALEPWYCWNNSLNGTMNHNAATLGSGYPSVLENRDYYNFNSSWSPGQALVTGIASGPLSQRPRQCTPGTDVATDTYGPGVGYWATDQNEFYVCTASNTWSPYYTPYVYPHPVITGIFPPPAAPTNLRVLP